MSESTLFNPLWASPPGDTILDLLRERKRSLKEFAADMGMKREFVEQLISGKARITHSVAKHLAAVLGGSPAFWVKREHSYRIHSEQCQAADSREECLLWFRSLPLKDMVTYGWIPVLPRDEDRAIEACLKFFDEPSISSWKKAYGDDAPIAAFRTSRSFASDAAAVAAWLRQGEILASSISCSPWSPETFKAAMPGLRTLTKMKDPEQFLPTLTQICAEAGVAVVVARSPNGCRASGATRFVAPDKALLMLSFRYLSDDHFWFTFFHEAGHLLLNDCAETFLEGLDVEDSQIEEAANAFAARTLIPANFEGEMLRLPLNGREVIRFAGRVGISPGIVVGQLQHRGHFTRRQLNDLKRKYKWGG